MNILDRIKIYNQLMDEKKEEAKKNKLERDSEGKPIIKLIPLEETVVHTPSQEEYDTLMQIYECGGWTWAGERLPTSENNWNGYGVETCINARKDSLRSLGYSPEGYYMGGKYKVLSIQKFYNKQKITKEQIKEIKNYFKNKK